MLHEYNLNMILFILYILFYLYIIYHFSNKINRLRNKNTQGLFVHFAQWQNHIHYEFNDNQYIYDALKIKISIFKKSLKKDLTNIRK